MVRKKATWTERNRKFDGRTYTYYNAYRTKKKARNAAHRLRLGVYHARVINHPGYPYPWGVYRSRKQR